MRNYADAPARGRPRAVHVSCVVRARRWSAMAGSRGTPGNGQACG